MHNRLSKQEDLNIYETIVYVLTNKKYESFQLPQNLKQLKCVTKKDKLIMWKKCELKTMASAVLFHCWRTFILGHYVWFLPQG